MDRWNGARHRAEAGSGDPSNPPAADGRSSSAAAKPPPDSWGYHTALSRLHAITMRLVHESDYQALLDAVVNAGIELTHAQKGTLQLCDANAERLLMVAQSGFDQGLFDFFSNVDDTSGACYEATRRGRRVVVEDVDASELLADTPAGDFLRGSGVRSLQSTPVWGRDGSLLGVLTTHWEQTHHPDERDLWLVDLLARQAADLIEHRRNAETLAYQAHLLDIAGDAIVAFDTQRRITYWNAGAEQMYGWSAGHAQGRSADEILRSAESVEDKIDRVVRMRRGEVVRGEYIHHRGDGSPFWAEMTARAFDDPHGNHGGYVAVIRDITQRKATEEQVAYQANLLGMANDAIIALDAERRISFWNPAAERMYGWSPDETQGRTVEDVLRPIKDINEKTQTQSRFRPGDTVRGEYLHHRKDGSQLWVESTTCAFFDDQGCVSGYVAVNRNITDRKRAEEELRRIRDELEERVAERTAQLRHRAEQLAQLSSQLVRAEQRERQRLAQVLHDSIQQLLVAAKLGLDVVRKRVTESQAAAIDRVSHLLDESLSASRSLTVELSPPVLHDGGLVHGLQWLADWMQEKYGLAVTLDAADYGGSECEDVRALVFQAVRELLFNVVKHAGTWEAQVTLQVQGDDGLRVIVSDHGRGFDPGRVREAPSQEGSSFGLFSIRERLGLLRGRLDVDSAPGRGTTFTLTVPRRRMGGAAA